MAVLVSKSRREALRAEVVTPIIVARRSEPTPRILQLTMLCSGKVQGTFADQAARRATQAGVRGVVRPTTDGRVELVAEAALADKAKLEDLEHWCKTEARPGWRVDHAEVTYSKESQYTFKQDTMCVDTGVRTGW